MPASQEKHVDGDPAEIDGVAVAGYRRRRNDDDSWRLSTATA
jgi:hypothetical protein